MLQYVINYVHKEKTNLFRCFVSNYVYKIHVNTKFKEFFKIILSIMLYIDQMKFIEFYLLSLNDCKCFAGYTFVILLKSFRVIIINIPCSAICYLKLR